MGVSAGEFFVNLGVKGSESLLNGLTNAKSGMMSLKDMSIEAKAAILATLYALEKIVSTTGSVGIALRNYGAMGLDPEILQRYEYAAHKVGIANESVVNSFLKMRDAAFDVRAGKGLPDWLAPIITSLAQHGKDIGPDWASRWQKNPALGFEAAQDFAKLTDIDATTRAIVLGRAFPADLVAGWMDQKLTKKDIANVPTSAILTAHQIDTLSKSGANLGSFWDKVGRLGEKLTSKGEDYIFHKSAQRDIDEANYKKLYGHPGGVHHHHGNTTKVDIHQTVNVHGGDPAKTKKATHDGMKDAAREIIPSLNSAQQSH